MKFGRAPATNMILYFLIGLKFLTLHFVYIMQTNHSCDSSNIQTSSLHCLRPNKSLENIYPPLYCRAKTGQDTYNNSGKNLAYVIEVSPSTGSG